jgi:hypothetical protein
MQITSPLPSDARRCFARPRTNGAAAISPQPIIRPMIAAQSSVWLPAVCEIAGTSVKKSHEMAVTENPQQRKRS